VRLALAVVAAVLFSAPAQARDAFDALRCGSDVHTALVGKTMPDGTAKAIEDRHKAIGLVDEGADEINDSLQMVGWTICGASYDMLIDNNGRIYDVLAFPAHSRQMPEFSGTCKRDGKELSNVIYAVLDNRAGFDPDPSHHSGAGAPLPALAAWRVDEHQRKFVALPAAGLLCPRDGMFTVDGGP